MDDEILGRASRRIADDVRATAGSEVEVRVREVHDDWWESEVVVDGRIVSTTGRPLRDERGGIRCRSRRPPP